MVCGPSNTFCPLSPAAASNISLLSQQTGINVEFPAGTTIGPGEYIVLAKDDTELAPLVPTGVTVIDYSGGLKNGGEEVGLIDAAGTVIESFRCTRHTHASAQTPMP